MTRSSSASTAAPLDQRRRPARPVARVVLGIRPEAFEDAAFARGDLPTLEARVGVVEELGSDAHVFFEVEAQRITAESLEATVDEATLLRRGEGAVQRARRPAHGRTRRRALEPRSRPRALPLLRSRDRREPDRQGWLQTRPQASAAIPVPATAFASPLRAVTKQSETRASRARPDRAARRRRRRSRRSGS